MTESRITDRRRWRIRWAVAAGAMVLAVLVFQQQLLPLVGHWLDVGELPKQTEYVMALGGGEENRPFVAAALVRSGFARRVLIATVRPLTDELNGLAVPVNEQIRLVMLRRGIAEDDLIHLDGQVGTTFDEANVVKQFLQNQPEAEIAIVTDDYHTRRSRWIFRRQLGQDAGRVYFVAASNDRFGQSDWWRDRDGLRSYTAEFFKLAYYWFRYGWGVMWLGALMLLVAVFRRMRKS